MLPTGASYIDEHKNALNWLGILIQFHLTSTINAFSSNEGFTKDGTPSLGVKSPT
jgi:hypothetical protein